MKITQEFTVAQPLPSVWAFFRDVPEVAACLPGAQYTGSPAEGRHTGRVTSKIGPFQASFEGEAVVVHDDDAKTVHVEGKGVDKKGASRSKMVMDCRVTPDAGGTRVSVDADIQLAGAIAQFGRTGLISEIANALVADFVRNAEAKLAATAPSAETPSAAPANAPPATGNAASLSAVRLIVISLRAWFRSLFRRAA